jgi:CheY-like chemotaxis protein
MAEQERKTVLIVDDDVQILLGLHKRLIHAGYDVLTATTGEEALAQAVEFRIDAITLDVALPGKMTGLGVAEALRSHSLTSRIPIIFVTGEADSRFKEKCARVSAQYFLAKPYDPDVLLKILEGIFAKGELARVRTLSSAKRRQPSCSN